MTIDIIQLKHHACQQPCIVQHQNCLFSSGVAIIEATEAIASVKILAAN